MFLLLNTAPNTAPMHTASRQRGPRRLAWLLVGTLLLQGLLAFHGHADDGGLSRHKQLHDCTLCLAQSLGSDASDGAQTRSAVAFFAGKAPAAAARCDDIRAPQQYPASPRPRGPPTAVSPAL